MDQATAAQFVHYVQAGDKAQAMRLLAAVLRQNPQDEQAWLAMAQITEGQQQQDCLKRVLAIAPNNAYAWRRLQAPPAPVPAFTTTTLPPTTARPAPAAPQVSMPPLAPAHPAEVPPAPAAANAAAPARRRPAGLLPWIILGSTAVGLACLLAAAGAGVLVSQWQLAAAPTLAPAATAARSGAVTPVVVPTFPPTWTPKPTLTPSPTRTPTLTATEAPTLNATEAVEASADRAQALIQSGGDLQAISLLDRVIVKAPRYARAYYLRAMAGLESLRAMDAHVPIQPMVYQYLGDINEAIQIGPPRGDYYLLRADIEFLLEIHAPLRVEQTFWYDLIVADSRQANALGNSRPASETSPAFNLAAAGHCQAAMDEANRLLKKAGIDPPGYDYYALADAYFCQGDAAQALKYLEADLRVETSEDRLRMRTVELYGLGRLDEARAQFDQMVMEYPNCTCRHALRVLIDVGLGDRQAALNDLAIAGAYGGPTPWLVGVFDYAQALVLINYQKDPQAAIAPLQRAEAELASVDDGPLMLAEVRKLLKQLGGTPLSPSLSVPPTPTPRPTPP